MIRALGTVVLLAVGAPSLARAQVTLRVVDSGVSPRVERL